MKTLGLLLLFAFCCLWWDWFIRIWRTTTRGREKVSEFPRLAAVRVHGVGMSDEIPSRPNKRRPSADLASAIIEANLILAKHEGMHHLHGDNAALIFMHRCVEKGASVDLADAERILQRMRRAAVTGAWSP